jgi:hypothetical protein
LTFPHPAVNIASDISTWFFSSVPPVRKPIFLLLLILGSPSLFAASVTSDEDRSRFVEKLYDQAEPGLRAPQEYVALAKKVISERYPRIALVDFADGVVTLRTYRGAPKAEREIICVNFAHTSNRGSHGVIGSRNFLITDTSKPVLLVLMRPNLSKTYVKLVHLKPR